MIKHIQSLESSTNLTGGGSDFMFKNNLYPGKDEYNEYITNLPLKSDYYKDKLESLIAEIEKYYNIINRLEDDITEDDNSVKINFFKKYDKKNTNKNLYDCKCYRE